MREIVVFFALIFSGLSAVDESSLSGRIVDATTGKPIGYVNIILVSTDFGDATDEDGWFILKNIPRGEYELYISHIGYQDEYRTIYIPQIEPLVFSLHETFFQMSEVVITGTRTKNIYSNVPIATEVVTRQDILDSGARDIAELLEERSGTFVNTSVAGGSILSLLGIDSKYILILVDGQPVTGKFNDRVSLDQFSTAMIEKVEIIKGPSSSLYGTEAMGGVVNIITHKEMESYPITIQTRFTGNDGSYNIVDGSRGTRDIRLNLVKRRKKVLYNLGFDLLKANVDQSNQYINVDEYDKISIQGGFKYVPLENHSFDLQFNGYANGESSHTRTLNADTDIQRNSLVLKHNWLLGDQWSLETVIRGADYERIHTQKRPWGELVNHNKSAEKQIEFEENILFENGNNSLNLGMEFSNSVFSNNRVLNGQQQLYSRGIFFQWHREVSDKIDAIIGSRFDYYNSMKVVLSPRLAMMYSYRQRWKFRASWGTGFRLPSFMDQYIDWDHIQFGYRILGNPDLKPESSEGISLGMEYYHPTSYQISLFIYQNRFKDMISDYSIEPGLFTYENVDRVLYRGIDIQGRWSISSQWLASWGYNYLDNRDESTGRMLANTQPHSASIRVSFKSIFGRFSSAIKIKLVGPYHPEEYIPESGEYIRSKSKRPLFGTINATGKIKLTQLFGFSFGVQNLTDYTDERYGPFIGRSIYIELITEI